MIPSTQRTVEADGLELWTEAMGDPEDPPVLLVMGAGGQGILWPDELCEALVEGERYVVRYDHRDTGKSTCFDFAEEPYTLTDMAGDAVGILDAYGIDRAHVVGASMGGMIGQLLALEHPERVASLTSIMSTPGGGAIAASVLGDDLPSPLPPPRPELLAALQELLRRPPRTREERIAQRVEGFRLTAGSLEPFDEERIRDTAAREVDRARDPRSNENHKFAVANEPDRRRALAGVRLPVLVVHGTEDPICPYEHGVATAEAIPGARLLTIEKMGHELPRAAWPRIVEAILEHTADGET